MNQWILSAYRELCEEHIESEIEYTEKSDTLNLVDISKSNCTSCWKVFGLMWNITLKFS